MLRETITQRHGGERTVAVVLTEAARTVATDGERSQQQVLPVVVDLSEERHEVVAFLDTRGALRARGGVRPHVLIVLQGVHLGVGREVVARLRVELQTGEDVECVLSSECEVVGGGVRPGPLHVVGLRNRSGRCGVVHHVGVPSVGHAVDEACIVVDTEVRTEQQTLDGSDVHVGITEDTPDLQTVVAVVIELAQGVLAVAHATNRTGEGHAVLFIDGHRRSHLQGVLQRLAVYLVRVSDGHVLTNGDEFVHLVAGVDTTGDALEVGVLQDTIVLLVAERNQRRCLLSSI